MVAFDKDLDWQVVDKYVAASKCGNYRLIKGYINNTVRYVPYYLDPDKPQLLSNGLVTVEAAKMVCETHNKTRTHGIRQSELIRSTQTAAVIESGSDGQKE